MSDRIRIKNGIGTTSYTNEEIKGIITDFEFLKDAFLVVLNPEKAKNSDLPFNKEQVIKYSKKMYLENTNFSKEFIKNIYKNQ